MAKGDHGFNARISSEGIGSRRIRVTGLGIKIGIVSTSEGEARSRRSYYPVVTTSSSFTMQVAFVTYEERERFNTWIRGYLEDLSEGRARSGFMTVVIPFMDFMRTCVLETPLDYGEGLTDLGYVTEMGFIGASEPMDINLGPKARGVSYFKKASDDTTSRYFYPAGRQIKGAEALDGTIFDPNAPSGMPFDPVGGMPPEFDTDDFIGPRLTDPTGNDD